MDIKAMHSRRRKRANHNFFIITVGYILMLLVLIFGTQDLMYRMGQKKKDVRVLHCEIENQSVATVCKMNVGDVVLFEDSLPQGKTTFDYRWHFDSTQTVKFQVKDTTLNFENIKVADSVSYLMVEVKPTKIGSLAIKKSFFE